MQQCGQTVHVAATVLKGLSTAESKCSDFITKVDVSFMVILMKVDQSGRHQWAHIFPKRKCYLCYAKDGAVSVTVFQARKIRRGRKRFLAFQKCLQYCKLEAQQSTIGQHALSFSSYSSSFVLSRECNEIDNRNQSIMVCGNPDIDKIM